MDNTQHSSETMTEIVRASGLRHLAFIMDGNGRWATRRMLPREAGHKVGADTFRKVVRYCGDIGIATVTVYAFSTENWKRPAREVNAILRILETFMQDAAADEETDRTRFCFIGDKGALPPRMAEKAVQLERETAHFPRLLNIALNYGGRAEITMAVNRLIAEGKTSVTEEDISGALYTSGCGDPDMIVRTASEYRLSNFMLWQAAYAEFYFTDTLWPDMKPEDVNRAVLEYAGRKRTRGGLC